MNDVLELFYFRNFSKKETFFLRQILLLILKIDFSPFILMKSMKLIFNWSNRATMDWFYENC